MDELRMPEHRLVETAKQFSAAVGAGMERDGQEIKCLLTYTRVDADLPDGRAIVVDLGGTRVRAAMIRAGQGGFDVLAGPYEADLPVRRGVPLDRQTYLDVQADLVARLSPPQNLPLGYCFSYPAASIPDGDARLLKWTKEIFVPGTEGELVGGMLLKELAGRGIRCSSVSVINDTVASLLAGLPGTSANLYIGLIVGTGNNMAFLADSGRVGKLPGGLDWSGPLPVNLESGNFTPAVLSRFDDDLDAASDNPGFQRLEKAVSGVYLGRLLQAVVPGLEFDAESGSKGVVELAGAPAGTAGTEAATLVLERSARLVAASIAGLVDFAGLERGTVRLVAEGGLFWGAPGYADVVRGTLRSVLSALGRGDVRVHVVQMSRTNLVGSAIAALNG